MYYYIYLIKFNTGKFYIGSRQSKVTPEDDTKYWGSPKTHKHLWKDTTLEKTKHILKVCSDFNKMRELEVKLIKEAWKKFPNECLNRCASKVFHPEAIKKSNITIAKKYSKEFILKSPTGEIISGKNITKFCEKERLDKGAISSLIIGKVKSHMGWRLPETKNIGSENTQKEFILKSPEGKIIKSKNITKFCKQNNLCQSAISSVICGKRKSHKGWTLPNTKITGYEAVSESLSKEFTLKSPSGEIVKGKNIRKFCIENSLNDSCIHYVISGKRKSHKGWTLP